MENKDPMKKIQDVIDNNRKNIDTTTKEERDAAFWKAAVEVFNEELAGDVTLADGRVINIPEL